MTNRNFLALIFVLVPVLASAENRWVTDEFEVMMRSGKSTKQSIIRQLKSGTVVEFLEADRESGYSRVRLGSGTEGWVLTRYLQRNPTAKLKLPETESRLQRSQARQTELEAELKAVKAERRTLERQLAELQSGTSSLQTQLDRITQLSADTIKVDQQNVQLKQRLAETQQKVETLEIENGQLASKANREWFLIGSAVLTLGLLLGLIIPRISWRKKSSWSDF